MNEPRAKLAIVIGAATPPGRLANALDQLVHALASHAIEAEIINLASLPPELCDGRPLDQFSASLQRAVAHVGQASAVLLASPVYRASYSGVLKNFLDLLPIEALQNKPVGIIAMGGSPHHYLGVDNQLRAVLAWFGALVAPNAVYLTSKDFSGGQMTSPAALSDLAALAVTVVKLAAVDRGGFGPLPLAARFT